MGAETMSEERVGSVEALPRLLSVRETSRLLAVSASKVYELVASRELPAFRPGGRIRISQDAIRIYLERTRVR
jgi:excisionase family DNA binding protein